MAASHPRPRCALKALHLSNELASATIGVTGSISSNDLTPMRRRRVPSFAEYVRSLPLEEQAKIRQAEREYLDTRHQRLRSEEQIFSEQMVGHEDTSAGSK